MYQRQSLQAIGPGRPLLKLSQRVSNVRYASEGSQGDQPQSRASRSNASTSNERDSPFNQANYGRSRQQQAAQISDEVRQLSRQRPTPKAQGSMRPTPAVRSRVLDSATGGSFRDDRRRPQFDARGGQRGGQPRSNDNKRRGKGRNGSRSTSGSDDFEAAEEEQEQGQDNSTSYELTQMEQWDRENATAVSFRLDEVSKKAFLNLGEGGAIIAGGNNEGVIEDRLKVLTETRQDGFRHPPEIAARMMKGGLVSFEHEAEKYAVMKAAKKFRGARIHPPGEGPADVEKKSAPNFAPLAESVQTGILDKLVRGKYTDLNANRNKQELLNSVAKRTMMNSTYLDKESSRFLKKVQSLLPAQNTQRIARPAPKAAQQ